MALVFALLPKHENNILSDPNNGYAETVAFSPDSRELAVGDYINNVYLWDVATRKVTKTLRPFPDSALDVAFSHNGKLLAITISKGGLYLYNTASSRRTRIFSGNADSFPSLVAFSPDGRFLAFSVRSDNDRGYLWKISTHRIVWSFPAPKAVRSARNAHINDLVFSRNGRFLAVAGSNGKTYLWQTATHKLASILTAANSRDAKSVAFNPNGKELAIGDENGAIYLWNTSRHKIIETLRDSKSQGIYSLMFSPDGKTLAAGGDAIVYLWDMRTRTITTTDDTLSGPADVAISPDGKILAAAANRIDLLSIHQH